jgi:hypothetical protein
MKCQTGNSRGSKINVLKEIFDLVLKKIKLGLKKQEIQ